MIKIIFFKYSLFSEQENVNLKQMKRKRKETTNRQQNSTQAQFLSICASSRLAFSYLLPTKIVTDCTRGCTNFNSFLILLSQGYVIQEFNKIPECRVW